jgi:hypothetical protein
VYLAGVAHRGEVSNMAQDKSNRELLISLSTDMTWVKQILTDHMAHHRRLLYAGIGLITAISAGVALNLLFT